MRLAHFCLASVMCTAGWAAAPSYSAEGIVNASNYAPGPFAPNSVITIFGSGLAWSAKGLTAEDIQGGMLPTSLNGVQVIVSGYPAPLFYVSETQINLLISPKQYPGTATVRVDRQGQTGPEVHITVVDAAPALFSSPLAPGYAIAQRWPEYSLVGPDAPAGGNDVIILYATGLGPTQPHSSPPGEIPAVPWALERLDLLRVYLDGVPLEPSRILWAGLSPGSAGLYQVNLKLPATLPRDPEIRVALGDRMSAPGARLAAIEAQLFAPPAR